MPHYLPLALATTFFAALAARPVAAQAPIQSPAPRAGRLHYEFTQRVDQQQVKVRMFDNNGQEIKTDGPGTTIELPTALSGQKSLVFSGSLGREERASNVQMAGGNISVTPSKAAATTRTQPPAVVETPYFDLANRTVIHQTTVAGTSYALPSQPLPAPPSGWRDWPQTRKIAGLQCHKATAPYRRETYTLWVTTELPFTYSPVPELTPARGVVLALNSDQKEFTATKLTAEPVAEADVRPSPQARPTTEAELKELRAKAQADMRQQMLEQYSGAGQR
ncbi:MAG: hypothetical protein ACRYFK_05120 [Janthinobacterium lividum]